MGRLTTMSCSILTLVQFGFEEWKKNTKFRFPGNHVTILLVDKKKTIGISLMLNVSSLMNQKVYIYTHTHIHGHSRFNINNCLIIDFFFPSYKSPWSHSKDENIFWRVSRLTPQGDYKDTMHPLQILNGKFLAQQNNSQYFVIGSCRVISWNTCCIFYY